MRRDKIRKVLIVIGTMESAMHHTPPTSARIRQGGRFPFNLFANYREPEHDSFLDRLEELQNKLPEQLPEKRFFRH
ncbi:MAG: hypothetical protein JJT95_06630 [Pararhodobacter sp.]|nr:hypothetical protein [Pararhodobacter sp.]